MDKEALKENIIAQLRTVFDPEIHVNIYDLGLIYRIDIDDDAVVDVDMTLTAPGCPVAHTFPGMVESKIKEVEGVTDAKVNLVWEPAWSKDNMTMEAQLELGIL
ncbi:MAG: SUF system Fe-S cluster assembly protein [Gammaproteobacteria bacterium]|nr:SUF system Fe-S cluster assembly protein [Gammaproteobacteria bacterium]